MPYMRKASLAVAVLTAGLTAASSAESRGRALRGCLKLGNICRMVDEVYSDARNGD